MKDKLRELAERWNHQCNGYDRSYDFLDGKVTALSDCADELLEILDADGDGGAVGEYVANVDKYGGILWLNGPPAHGTKIYTHPARSGVVSEEAVRDAERYRWLLKTVDHDCEYQSLEDLAWYALHNESSEKITKAIDAAIQGERHEL